MSGALGGLSAAKRRRGIASPMSTPTNVGKQQQFVDQHNEAVSNLKQVNPIEMLKLHELRLRRIESIGVTVNGGGEVTREHQSSMFDERVETLMNDTASNIRDTNESIREMKSTILTLQTLVLNTTQTIENLKNDIQRIKTEMATNDLSRVSVSLSDGKLDKVEEE